MDTSDAPREEYITKLKSKSISNQDCRSACQPEDRSTPATLSTASDGSSKPQSLRRIIRADDSWQAERQHSNTPKTPRTPKTRKPSQTPKTPQTAFRVNNHRNSPLQPGVLQPAKVKEFAFQRPVTLLRQTQPFKTPERPSGKDLLAQDYSDEDLKPEPLFVRKRSKSLGAPLNTPKLTRELVFRHFYWDSDVSIENYSKAPSSSDESTSPEVLREIKKARRAGVIFERDQSSSEDDAKFDREIDERTHSMASLLRPESAVAMTEHRREAVRLAKSQESSVIEKCKRGNQEIPHYVFDELIGKGSYGRVYKGRHTTTSKIVAIKVIDIDEADFHSAFEEKDDQIKDFNREIRILKQAQDSGAPNMNLMIEALPVHSQLWLVCEYCPGGSVKTLMRATNDRLSESYIIVVARELAKALAGLHDAGIMHRDIKAANVLIHEDGNLQLCDFGVATVLDTKSDKRKTFIGTPHWMPPELFVENPEYSDEVDVWEYGCTLYECAVGNPPHSDLRERQQLASRMRRLKESISLPEHEEFSDGLRDLVAYTLSPDATSRPSMREVLSHSHLLDTEVQYPTTILSQLVKVYYAWLYGGGQRASLFMPGGAVASGAPGSITSVDEWNFSTTEIFEKRVSAMMDIPDFTSQTSPLDANSGEETPRALNSVTSPQLKEMTNVQKANFEARVQRGEVGLGDLFNEAGPQYEYKTRTDFRPQFEERRVSDLPFRAMAEDRPSSIASNVIDLGDFDSEDYAIAAPMEETIQLADAATIRAKRSDSKGPGRDTSATRAAASISDMSGNAHENPQTSSVHDFSFPPKEWADENSTNGFAPTKDDGRKTMDWTFASAFSSSADGDDDEPQPAPTKQQTNAKKHATLEWSFSNAQAAVDTTSEDGDDDAPPSTHTRTTPRRHVPLLRTMTQPVTSTEVYTAAEEFPRPSTAMSDAYSESSISSADFDPFALEGNQDLPTSVTQAMDNMNVGSYYPNNKTTLTPEHTVPYTSTIAGPVPYMGSQPARLTSPSFPGPQSNIFPSSLSRARNRNLARDHTSSNSDNDGRPHISLPEAIPPSTDALALDASDEVVGAELSRLLGGFQGSLVGVGQALGMMRPGRKNKKTTKTAAKGDGKEKNVETPRGRGRRGSSEWEDEE